MRKKIIGVAIVATIGLAAAWNFAQSDKDTTLTDLVLNNVDALASKKPPTPPGCWYTKGDSDCSSSGAIGCACI